MVHDVEIGKDCLAFAVTPDELRLNCIVATAGFVSQRHDIPLLLTLRVSYRGFKVGGVGVGVGVGVRL